MPTDGLRNVAGYQRLQVRDSGFVRGERVANLGLPYHPRIGCATLNWESSCPTSLPAVFEAVVQVGAAEGEDGVGAGHRAEHAGLLEAFSVAHAPNT
jgi:hypothetical protein